MYVYLVCMYFYFFVYLL